MTKKQVLTLIYCIVLVITLIALAVFAIILFRESDAPPSDPPILQGFEYFLFALAVFYLLMNEWMLYRGIRYFFDVEPPKKKAISIFKSITSVFYCYSLLCIPLILLFERIAINFLNLKHGTMIAVSNTVFEVMFVGLPISLLLEGCVWIALKTMSTIKKANQN